jgi:hypothetical protein
MNFVELRLAEVHRTPLLGSWVNKGAPDQELRVSSLLMSFNSKSGMPMETISKTTSLELPSIGTEVE